MALKVERVGVRLAACAGAWRRAARGADAGLWAPTRGNSKGVCGLVAVFRAASFCPRGLVGGERGFASLLLFSTTAVNNRFRTVTNRGNPTVYLKHSIAMVTTDVNAM